MVRLGGSVNETSFSIVDQLSSKDSHNEQLLEMVMDFIDGRSWRLGYGH